MANSMTAFGRARTLSADGSKDITAEIKSVNSRYLDCTVKLARIYSFLEEKIKAYLTEKGITRGKVEVYIGVDVLEQEPPRQGSLLIGARNCYITPHIGWDTPEARQRILALLVSHIRAYYAGKPESVVNDGF